jgi:adenylate kinase family enzyme
MCDIDGAALVQRADDQPKAIRERLRIYRHNSGKLIRFYRRRNYHRIWAARPPEAISHDLFRLAGVDRSGPADEYERLVLARPSIYA